MSVGACPAPTALALQHKRVSGWPGDGAPGSAVAVPLDALLTRPWSTDVHFTAYAPTQSVRRLRVELLRHPTALAAEGGRVVMQLAVFDCDDPVAHAAGSPARPEWRYEVAPRIHAAAAAHLGAFAYWTRGGARLLWAIDPIELTSLECAARWSALYLGLSGYLRAAFGLAADESCTDWTRLFRAPHVVRDGQSEQHPPLIGDARAVGVLRADVRPWLGAVRATQRCASIAYPHGRAFNPLRAGLVPTLLRNRGWLGRELEPGKWICRCPSSSERGDHGLDSSTVAYAANRFASAGWLHCSHARCSDLRGGDPAIAIKRVLSWFTADEIACAERHLIGAVA